LQTGLAPPCLVLFFSLAADVWFLIQKPSGSLPSFWRGRLGRLSSRGTSPSLAYAPSTLHTLASAQLQGTKQKKTLKTILVLVEDGFHSRREKPSPVPNAKVPSNRKAKKPSAYQPDKDTHARNYLKKF